MSSIRKFITALVGVLIAILLTRYGHTDQLVNTIILLATAAGVYVVPNN